MATETALEVQALIGLVLIIAGLAAVLAWTLPTTIRDYRSYEAGTPERVLFSYDLRLACVSLLKLTAMLTVIAVILLTEPSMLRSAIIRPLILVLVAGISYTAILAPLRRRAIERTVRERESRERRN